MRGKAQAEQVRRFLNGITPAYAGKSVSRLLRKASLWDHPRVCGEKSSNVHGGGMFPWITPAYAGKRFVFHFVPPLFWDHPRVCGEKLAGRCPAPAGLGSPPRMRGKVSRLRYLSRHSRITPAYAGKRILRRLRQISPLDHPRVCGEKCVGSGGQCGAAGSPPRMRGKGTMERKKQSPDRITPAYAGKSPVRVADYRAGEDHPRVCGEKDLELSAETVGLGSPPRMRGKVNLTK